MSNEEVKFEVEAAALAFRRLLGDVPMPPREKALALTKLDECLLWATKTLHEKAEQDTRLKLMPREPIWLCDDEAVCPFCREPVDETDDPLQCTACHQLLDWSKT